MRRWAWTVALVGAMLLPAAASAALARHDVRPASAALETAAAGRLRTAPFIVGGSAAAPGQLGWTSFVAVFQGDDPFATCTGSLVGERVVITAAHCVLQEDGPDAGEPLPDLGLLVVTATNDVDDPSAPVQGVTTVYTAAYDPPTSQNDLAVLVLDEPSPGRAIPLVRPDQAGAVVPGAPAVASGWGVTTPSGSDVPSLMRFATLPVLSDQTCAADWPVMPDAFLFNAATNLCAGYQAGGIGACSGDSGGPLALDTPAGPLLIGATSWGGVPCAQPGEPTVFTRISAFTPQVAATLAADPDVRAGPPQTVGAAAGPPADGQAAVAGSVLANGLATRAQVQYGPSEAYGQTAYLGDAGDGHQVVPVSGVLSGLAPGTTYHYRLVADNAAGVAVGQDATFATPAPPAPPPVPPAAAGTPAAASAAATPPPVRAAVKTAPKTKRAPCAGRRGAAKRACLLARRRALALKACSHRPKAARPACRARARRLR